MTTKRNGQRATKSSGAAGVAKAKSSASAGSAPDANANARSQAQADLARMISELNEVRMRLDSIVRKLTTSAVALEDSDETIDDVERLRMRLVGKLDRMREELVTRLGEERTSRPH